MKKVYLIILSILLISVNQAYSQDTNLVYGCTNPLADNYNPDATEEDYTCYFNCDTLSVGFTVEEVNLTDSYVTIVADHSSPYGYNEFIWNFGDGSDLVYEEYPTHVYDDYGYYAVCVTMWTITVPDPVDWTVDFDTCEVYFCDSIGITLFAPQEDGFTLNIISETALSVNEFNNGITEMVVYPNPATNEISLNFELKQQENVIFCIYDHSGRLISKWNQNLASGLHSKEINLNDFTSGLYLLELTTLDSRQTKTFQIVE